MPSLPSNVSNIKNIDKYNTIVSDAFNTQVMVKCPNCSRTFLEDRIEVHLKSCRADNPCKPPPSKTQEKSENSEAKIYSAKKTKIYSPEKNEKTFAKPRALMCHIW